MVGAQICLLSPSLYSVDISADLLEGHLQNTHTDRHGQPRQQRQPSGSAGCEGGAATHRLPVGVLPQVAIAVAGRGDADVVLVGAVAS